MQESGAELFAAMELEMEARAPAQAAARMPRSRAGRGIAWVLSFAVPGLGMFTEVESPPCPADSCRRSLTWPHIP